ncbi:MAG: PEP-utilizing enzyme [Desulfobacteraceae bacterium]|nr:PEP-utilizing enzyme [Desulfobacteraceae bacterium]
MRVVDIIRAWGRKPQPIRLDRSTTFQAKYFSFKELLAANTGLLDIIAELEEALQGRRVFGLAYVRTQAHRAVHHTLRMIHGLNYIGGRKYLSLMVVLDQIDKQIKALIEQPQSARAGALVLAYDGINKEMLDWVGGKSANLGEVHTALQIPIPEGFAITTLAFERFMANGDLVERVTNKLNGIDPTHPEKVAEVGAAIRELIMAAEVPAELQAALAQAASQLSSQCPQGVPLRLAMRSSAIGEDSELTFAGQYQSLLNVTEDQVIDAYRRIVASLYTDRALMYRLTKGIPEEHMAMGVACLQMVPSVASGVMYSRDPADPAKPDIIINAVWGLGPYAVDGIVAPDLYIVDRDSHRILTHHITTKAVQLIMGPAGGVTEAPVAPERQAGACLTRDQIMQLADWAVRLEQHYGTPQDIEWALAPDGRLVLLQARPLPLISLERVRTQQATARYNDYKVLADGGLVVCPGVGHGPAFHVESADDLMRIAQGAVLVAKHSSPRFVIAMAKVSAIVAEVGSITGHMASLAREFKVPTVLELKDAKTVIPNGVMITVDAFAGVVYEGRVEPLLALKPLETSVYRETTAYRTLRQVADLIIPLNLVDPKSSYFKPESCRTIHDIMRIVHEFCYKEMFQLSDLVSYREGAAVKLNMPLPIDLYLIDLGGGLELKEGARRKVKFNEVHSIPLKAVLKGMLHKDLCCPEPRPIELAGFFSVMREQMLAPPTRAERFGDRSYAIVSDKYLNFSSRVGYHYSILDSYCGESVSKNYITFSFKGGAADEVRRNRRVRAIARILERLDFAVEVKSDQVDARLLKYENATIEDKLEQIGRLLLYTRQMDMLMNSEASVETAAQSFLKENYRLQH